MSNISPFAQDRWEYDQEHLFYLEPDLFQVLQRAKPTYLLGSRGTGKTTLLRSLDWRSRLNNESLKPYLDGFPFNGPDGPFVGVYIRLPDIQLNALDQWLGDTEADVNHQLTAAYLDLVWIQELTEALSSLLSLGHLESSPAEEQQAVKRLFERYPATLGRAPVKGRTLHDLQAAVRRLRRLIEVAALSRASVEDIVSQVDFLEGIGSVGRTVGTELVALCVSKKTSKQSWFFKICFDEGEFLTDYQLRVFNTLIRQAATPVLPAIAFLGTPASLTETVYDVRLQSDDRDLIDLGVHFDDPAFRRFAEGVTSVRLAHALGERRGKTLMFSAERILGELDLNRQIGDILSGSEAPLAARLKEAAQEAATKQTTAKNRRAKKGLPYYQAYLQMKLGDPPAASVSTRARRRLDSAKVRKKMVAAYLSICRDLGAEPRYCSADMVFGLSDGCIRDYLKLMDRIFLESGLTVETFALAGSKISDVDQDRAIKAASTAKYQGVVNSGVLSPDETELIIRGVGWLTAFLQSSSPDGAHLRSTERGLFRLTRTQNTTAESDEQRILENIVDAAELSFFKIVEQGSTETVFRIHNSLAPRFGSSYRGAYYETKLEWKNLHEMLGATSEGQSKDIARAIAYGKGDQATLDLFKNG